MDQIKPTFTAQQPTSSLLDGFRIAVQELVRRHRIATEELTENQMVEAIKQALLTGDFQRQLAPDGRQSVLYLPGLEADRVKRLYDELIYAVESKHDGESRHETALRYIRERENRVESPSQETNNP